jgi:hypothetical protein
VASLTHVDAATLYEWAHRARNDAETTRAETHMRLAAVGWNSRRLRRSLTRCAELRASQPRPIVWSSSTRGLEDVVVLVLTPDDAS